MTWCNPWIHLLRGSHQVLASCLRPVSKSATCPRPSHRRLLHCRLFSTLEVGLRHPCPPQPSPLPSSSPHPATLGPLPTLLPTTPLQQSPRPPGQVGTESLGHLTAVGQGEGGRRGPSFRHCHQTVVEWPSGGCADSVVSDADFQMTSAVHVPRIRAPSRAVQPGDSRSPICGSPDTG